MNNKSPLQQYQSDLASGDFQPDSAQANAVSHLQRIYEDFVAREGSSRKQPWYKKLVKGNTKVEGIRGVYFWGGVGRGKTYLMDTFYECLPGDKKMRVHFHRFMHRVHQELTALKGIEDPLINIAETLSKEASIICFDEFFVSDITDAMLLGGLFEQLFARGTTLVATSNIPPKDLYLNGLQRVRFLPTIALIEANNDIVNVDSGIDYRLRTLQNAEIYHHPLDEEANINLNQYFDQLAVEPKRDNVEINVLNRNIAVRREADGIGLFEFAVLCESNRSQVDYIEISRCYNTILLANVKVMGGDADDAARRFIALVDEFYERNVKLIISAEVAMEVLYKGGILSFEFKRCLSRLQEMQSTEYLGKAHLP
ncbi:MAG: cell division protein ZapE [Phenylobacterium sp.]|jgi:cell division protein ZapE